jgi:small nuclear ribonucleoprotein B and B'
MTNEQGVATILSWLNKRLRITITDSRAFEGWFKCIDRDANIVLAGAEEFRDGLHPTSPLRQKLTVLDQERLVGLIVIPGKYVTRAELIHSPQNPGVL